MGGLARLILALVCLAVSLTAFIRAPNLPAWMLLLGVTEFGHWFALVALAVAIPFQFHPLGLAASGVAIVVAGLFLSTLAQALPFGARLPAQLQAAFGPVPPAGRPFFWRSLIFGVREKQVGPETFISSEGEGYSLRLNFFRSVRPDPAPCVLVLHTGGWNSGWPDEFAALHSPLANRGYAVVALPYRLAPEWIWPAQLEDVEAAWEFLKQRSADLGIDAAQSVLLGRSAGGQIAEASADSLSGPEIRGCIAFYAPADLPSACRFGREDDILKSLQLARDFLGGPPGERPANYDSASALQFVNPAHSADAADSWNPGPVGLAWAKPETAGQTRGSGRAAPAHRAALGPAGFRFPFQRTGWPVEHVCGGLFSVHGDEVTSLSPVGIRRTVSRRGRWRRDCGRGGN